MRPSGRGPERGRRRVLRAQEFQHTLQGPAIFAGVGVHTGAYTRVAVRPALANTGIVFVRTDVADRDNRVAMDRYVGPDGQIRDYVVAARELNPDRLIDNQRDWINRHTVYTHGHGFVSAYGNRRQSNVLPVPTSPQILTKPSP